MDNTYQTHTCTDCIHIPKTVKGNVVVSALIVSVLINLAVFVTYLVALVSTTL
jgi:hypothetical protein